MSRSFVRFALHSSRNESSYTGYLFGFINGFEQNRLTIESEKRVSSGAVDLVVRTKDGDPETVYVFEIKYLDGEGVGSKNTKEVGELLKTTVNEGPVSN